MAPKRRDYGKGVRQGRKEDKLWDLFKSGVIMKLQNWAQSISKLLVGDEYDDDGM